MRVKMKQVYGNGFIYKNARRKNFLLAFFILL